MYIYIYRWVLSLKRKADNYWKEINFEWDSFVQFVSTFLHNVDIYHHGDGGVYHTINNSNNNSEYNTEGNITPSGEGSNALLNDSSLVGNNSSTNNNNSSININSSGASPTSPSSLASSSSSQQQQQIIRQAIYFNSSPDIVYEGIYSFIPPFCWFAMDPI